MVTSLILLAALAGGAAKAQEPLVEWHEQVVQGACVLRFAVPQGWDVDARSPGAGVVSLVFQPKSGPRASVRVSGTVEKGSPELKSSSDIKRAVKTMGEALLPGSVEKKLDLVRVDGRDGTGFVYSLTDARAQLPEGEFRTMTQGIMAVGPLRLAVTVLADEPDSAAKRLAVDFLRTADCPALPAK